MLLPKPSLGLCCCISLLTVLYFFKKDEKKAALGPGEGLTECLLQCNTAALNHPGEALHSCPELAFSDVAFSLSGDG